MSKFKQQKIFNFLCIGRHKPDASFSRRDFLTNKQKLSESNPFHIIHIYVFINFKSIIESEIGYSPPSKKKCFLFLIEISNVNAGHIWPFYISIHPYFILETILHSVCKRLYSVHTKCIRCLSE